MSVVQYIKCDTCGARHFEPLTDAEGVTLVVMVAEGRHQCMQCFIREPFERTLAGSGRRSE
jgi:hypothetical protein